MRSANRLSLAALALLATGTGCTVGPTYAPPKVEVPDRFGESPPTSQPATQSVTDIQLATWWNVFSDAELGSLVTRAVKANTDLQVATARVKDARAAERVARASLYPNISVGASATRNRGSSSGIGSPYGLPGKEIDLYDLGVDASYEVDLFGGVRRSIEVAGATAQSTEEQRRTVQVTLLGDVARTYIGYRALQLRLKVARLNLEDQMRTLDIVERRVHNGLATNFDDLRARAQVELTRSSLPPLEAALRQSVHTLSFLLGEPPLTLDGELAAEGPIPNTPDTIATGLPIDLLAQRPDIRAAERAVAATTAQVGVARATQFPRLTIGATAGFQSTHFDDLFERGTPSSGYWVAGPSVDWSIFDGGRRSAAVDRARAQVEAAIANYRGTVLGALRDVESACSALRQDQVRLETLALVASENEAAVVIAKKQYKEGIITLLDVLDVQRNLYSAQDALAVAHQSVAFDVVVLYKSLGGGWQPGAEDKQ